MRAARKKDVHKKDFRLISDNRSNDARKNGFSSQIFSPVQGEDNETLICSEGPGIFLCSGPDDAHRKSIRVTF